MKDKYLINDLGAFDRWFPRVASIILILAFAGLMYLQYACTGLGEMPNWCWSLQ